LVKDIPKPGGDKIGRRRLDTHFEGFINLGAKFRYNKEDHFMESRSLKDRNLMLLKASATELLALAKETTVYNAACEPFLQQL
jgi:UDP-N-acetylglucosamine 1-carboxyvinyltransferase